MSDDITHDLDLLDDWLAGNGYGEEAGLVLRALSLIHKQSAENEKLRAALKRIHDAATDIPDDEMSYSIREWWWNECRAAAAALKETGDD